MNIRMMLLGGSAAASLLSAQAANAQEVIPAEPTAKKTGFTISGTYTGINNYLFNGVSQTENGHADQFTGIVTLPDQNTKVTLWASNVSENQYPGSDGVEVDLMADHTFSLSEKLKLNMLGAGYLYPGQDAYNYGAARFSLSYQKSENTTIGGSYELMRPLEGGADVSVYKLNASRTIRTGSDTLPLLTVVGEVGTQKPNGGKPQNFASVMATLPVGDHLSVTAGVSSTNHIAGPNPDRPTDLGGVQGVIGANLTF